MDKSVDYASLKIIIIIFLFLISNNQNLKTIAVMIFGY